MRIRSRLLVGACAVLLPGTAWCRATDVSFPVTIQNRSAVPCLASGSGPAEIAATLVTPRRPSSSLTVYVHGLGFDRTFWSFDAVPDLDYAAALARAGHASLLIDRLGYGDSTKPDGNASCIGVQADIVHQVIEQIPARFPQFTHIALAGHSAGAAVAQVEAYSFHDVEALVLASYADQGASPDALSAFVQAGVACATGQAPQNYASFGPSAGDYSHLMFNTPRPLTGQLPIVDSPPTADPDVISIETQRRTQDPCGDDNSLPFEIVLSQLLLSQIDVPVLLVCGDRDAIFPPPACDLQALHFVGNTDFTHSTISGAGHAVTLGTTAGAFRDAVSTWLEQRGF
jgi:pimeloyl-ACP methyl ester carboxylesterase